LFPKPSASTAIFERSGGGGIVIRKELLKGLRIEKWPHLVVEDLAVLTSPEDGLCELSDP
jgi:hypothetical protein